MDKERIRTSFGNNAFSSVAFWQLMVFILLLCFAWTNELVDLPAIVFGANPTTPDYYRLSFLSAGIITAAIVAIGHTYEKQKSVVANLIESCPYCHRVKTDSNSWQHIHEYFTHTYLLDVQHGLCPDCKTMLEAVSEKEAKKAAGQE